MTDTTAGEGVTLADQIRERASGYRRTFESVGIKLDCSTLNGALEYGRAQGMEMAATYIDALAAQPSAGAQGEAGARVARFLAEWSRGIGYGETLYSDLIREVRAGTDREAKLTVTDLRALISTSPSTDAVTSIVDAAKEAGWAMMEVVDGIAWKKRQQFSDIAARLARSIESLESPPRYTTPAQPDTGDVAALREAIAACKGEQEHFETWANSHRYDMSEHPLHYIFNDPKTDAARMGWNAALAYVREQFAALSKTNAQGRVG